MIKKKFVNSLIITSRSIILKILNPFLIIQKITIAIRIKLLIITCHAMKNIINTFMHMSTHITRFMEYANMNEILMVIVMYLINILLKRIIKIYLHGHVIHKIMNQE
ncbi:hypothetical protein PVNG_04734 [Plasmodium vivax North Korean]|uniref:Uncharacterized protein n=1 Tax=Plasmodium vivax North Korean TaxID=1035514 RepID=A0A0J9U3I1_PLAVI|nr:hypothetical protein PVNG_04734 [Plasmodium vivax North Korean]